MTEPNRQSGENEERIIEIEIERLRPFKEHPFQLIHVCRFGRDCFFSRLFSDLHPRIRGDNRAELKC